MMPVSKSTCCTVLVASWQVSDSPLHRLCHQAPGRSGGVVITSNTIHADERGGSHTVAA